MARLAWVYALLGVVAAIPTVPLPSFRMGNEATFFLLGAGLFFSAAIGLATRRLWGIRLATTSAVLLLPVGAMAFLVSLAGFTLVNVWVMLLLPAGIGLIWMGRWLLRRLPTVRNEAQPFSGTDRWVLIGLATLLAVTVVGRVALIESDRSGCPEPGAPGCDGATTRGRGVTF